MFNRTLNPVFKSTYAMIMHV